MKLGLVRHFKVNQNKKKYLSSAEFGVAMKEYDLCPVIPNEVNINQNDWDICYCSTLPRAVTTAKTICNKKIIQTDLIVEVPISPFTKRKITLPLFFWHLGARIAWYKSHSSQKENITQTKERIENFYKIISESGYENILIVAHGYFLNMFYQEMKKKGFIGEVDFNMKNGVLYTIKK
jgi:broad specificity phosphatase PhoE